MSAVKRFIRRIFPKRPRDGLANFRFEKKHQGLETGQIFSKIYKDGVWGKGEDRYFSGSGSHDAAIVGAYVAAVGAWCAGFPRKLNAVDLGCGDFSVGARLRPFFGAYTACDVVPDLIARNARKFAGLDVDFRVADLSRDALPEGEVVLIRQVLQHLSNDLILRALPAIARGYSHLILTEHIPATDDFAPNLDKLSGPNIRLGLGSGIVLTKPPFDLKPVEETVLCEVAEYGGRIRTIAYRLK
jgi:hypothetical protein